MGQPVPLTKDSNLLEAWLEFLYNGTVVIMSDVLVDLLDLAHEFMMPVLKHAIERVLCDNIAVDNFLDTYLVSKSFDCATVYQKLIVFGTANAKDLRNAGVFPQIDSHDVKLILKK